MTEETTKAVAGRKPLYPEIGVTGLKRYSGFVYEEYLTELRGQRGTQVFREMRDMSAEIGAALGAAQMSALGATWSVDPNEDDPDGQERADFISSCMHDMSYTWRDTIREAWTMLTYGFAPHEIVYKRRLGATSDSRGRSKFTDGLIGWRKLPLRAQETVFKWEFDAEGGIEGLWQLAPPSFQMTFIPIEKLLLFRTTAEKNNPEGRSVMRNAYRPYFLKKRVEEILVIGLERDLNGLPVIYVPPEVLDASTPEKAAVRDQWLEIGKNIKIDEQACILAPSVYNEGGQKMYDVTLLATAGRKQFDHVAIVGQLVAQVTASVLYDMILGGQANTIQYRGDTPPDMFTAAVGGWLDVIADVFNAHAIPRLYKVNGWPTEACAVLRHGEVRPADLGKVADFLSKIAPSGFVKPTPETEQHLRRLAGLPTAGETAPLLPDPEGQEAEPGAADDTDAEPEAPTKRVPVRRGRPRQEGEPLTTLSARLPTPLRDRLDREAMRQRKSTSDLVRELLEGAATQPATHT